MKTYTKREINPLNFSINEIDIRDIAHSLSNLCRFTGHCSPLYSVGEHSLLVAQLLPQEDKLYGLLHDAHEMFMGDINPYLKDAIPELRFIQQQIQDKINRKYNITGNGILTKHRNR